MATIVKTDSGTWKALIRRVGWPTTSKTFRIKRDAEDWARRTEDEMVRGTFIERGPSEKMTVSLALARYKKEIMPNKSESSQNSEKYRIVLLDKYFGKYSLAAVTSDLVAKYRDDRLAQNKSNNTVKLELALLSHLFTVAIKEWHIGLAYNPVANVRKPKSGPGRTRRLSAVEEKKLITAVNSHSNPMLGWIVGIAIETGMRTSEIITLDTNQVNLLKRTIFLDKTKNGSSRTVPLTKLATELFELALANPMRPSETNLIFFGEPSRDKSRKPYQFKKKWIEIKKNLGFIDLHFHDLRHEAVSRFVEAGLTDQEVASISGHKSMQMLRRYTHLRAEDLVKKLDKVDVDKASLDF